MMAKEKIIIPEGLKIVECIANYYKCDKKRRNLLPFTVGKKYRVIKISRAALVIKDDNGVVNRRSYRFFKPVEITKRKPKPLKKKIADRLIKILKQV
jgi:hypothetical protein